MGNNNGLLEAAREERQTIPSLKTLFQLKAIFSRTDDGELEASIKQFLDSSVQQLGQSSDDGQYALFVEHLETLLKSEDSSIQQFALRWLFNDLIRFHRLPKALLPEVVQLIRSFHQPWLAYPLLDWLAVAEDTWHPLISTWLTELDYRHPEVRSEVIGNLLNKFLNAKNVEPVFMEALKRLDSYDSAVTDRVLHCFPTDVVEHNQRMIHLLGYTGRYRVVKPLIAYAEEYPEYLRAVMKALSRMELDDVDEFYINCLDRQRGLGPMILMDAVKQIRKRRLRRAIPYLEAIFPMEDSQLSLINRALNGEIALTMASFGAYGWAREKLLSEIVLNGMNPNYLKAIDMLQLEEAVPLLKAILLMPDTPEISLIQEQAYQICAKIMASQKQQLACYQ